MQTLKTILGFLISVLERRFGRSFKPRSIENIYNYLTVSDSLATSGQPDEFEFGLIKSAGYDCVINLAPSGILENSLANEPDVVRELQMEYVHIPVDFAKPTEADFELFVGAMRRYRGKQIWVHCAANMRVSAFIYRFQTTVVGEDECVAHERLAKIWQPRGVWSAFLEHS